ncbi:MAG: hypothetical protein DRP11_00470 [Candidatus Aenigmatarchaeota archaeon]|nr:MAG: hypothetical protein DRP11_00470 [Candidatus Aenigmarchaeota archaeon]
MDECRCSLCGKNLCMETDERTIRVPEPHFYLGGVRLCDECLGRLLRWAIEKYKKEVGCDEA